MTQLRVLVKIQDGYGLGDVVQATVILKHLKKYRPHWLVDFYSREGTHSAVRGLANRIWHENDPPPENYDRIIHTRLHDVDLGWTDRPCTKTTTCLHERFGIPYDASLGRYEIQVSQPMRVAAQRRLRTIGVDKRYSGVGAVGIHYQGSSSPYKKDLPEWQAKEFCRVILEAGWVPVIFDWERKCPLVDSKTIFNSADSGLKGAESLAAIISELDAYIGVDSGPGHVASATETPTAICWTHNHPIFFHDPAPNTLHFVPPVLLKDGQREYFESAYRWQRYQGDNDLVRQVHEWLAGVLRIPVPKPLPMAFVVQHNFVSVLWALSKVRKIAQGRPIHILLSGTHQDEARSPLILFIRRFSFVKDVCLTREPICDPERPVDVLGRGIYEQEGRRGEYYVLTPERAIETGRPIEEWQGETDWGIWNCYQAPGCGYDGRQAVEKVEARIVVRERPDGKREIFIWSPSELRKIDTGLLASTRSEVDRNIHQMKQTLEKAGNHVTVLEM